MKRLLIIIGFILSCYFSGSSSVDEIVSVDSQFSFVASSEHNTTDQDLDCKSPGILPSRTVGYSGGNNSLTFSVKAAFSKLDRIIGRHKYYSFLTELKQFSSGIRSINRYIHTLCQLLI